VHLLAGSLQLVRSAPGCFAEFSEFPANAAIHVAVGLLLPL
jgi:hypothetical protein